MSFRNDKEWNIDTWYNANNPKILLSKGNQIKSHMPYNFPYTKYSEYLRPWTQKPNANARIRAEMESLHLINMEFSLRDIKYFKTWKTVNVLHVTEMCIWKWLIYVMWIVY